VSGGFASGLSFLFGSCIAGIALSAIGVIPKQVLGHTSCSSGVIFVTLEDEWARLMVVEGSVERESKHAEVPITHVICKRLLDRTDLLNSLRQGNAVLVRADEVRRLDPGSARGQTKVPGSRDFH
jgi:hypothetical protein